MTRERYRAAMLRTLALAAFLASVAAGFDPHADATNSPACRPSIDVGTSNGFYVAPVTSQFDCASVARDGLYTCEAHFDPVHPYTGDASCVVDGATVFSCSVVASQPAACRGLVASPFTAAAITSTLAPQAPRVGGVGGWSAGMVAYW
ncbi:MAG: hypothetical protein ACYDCK_11745 [Thermoplasmatota archaeon]